MRLWEGLEERGEAAIRRMTEIAPLAEGQVRAALRYYADAQDEIDERIAREEEASVRAQAAWERERSILNR